jgi:hypothetical protein
MLLLYVFLPYGKGLWPPIGQGNGNCPMPKNCGNTRKGVLSRMAETTYPETVNFDDYPPAPRLWDCGKYAYARPEPLLAEFTDLDGRVYIVRITGVWHGPRPTVLCFKGKLLATRTGRIKQSAPRNTDVEGWCETSSPRQGQMEIHQAETPPVPRGIRRSMRVRIADRPHGVHVGLGESPSPTA